MFRSTNISEQKTELLIVLTVDVIRTDEDAYRMSVEQRDKFVLPDSVRQNPLMEGLRVLPDENLLGPNGKRSLPPERDVPREERKLYGPKPKTYGPKVTRPSTVTEAVDRPVYGPSIASSDPAPYGN